MDREEILKSAQKNRIKGQEYERSSMLRGDNLAANIGILICMILFFIKLFIEKQVDIGVSAIFFSMLCIQSFNEGIRLKKWWIVITGIFETVLALVLVFLFIGVMFVS